MSNEQQLTPAGKEAIKAVVREIAKPAETAWEAFAAFALLLIDLLTIPVTSTAPSHRAPPYLDITEEMTRIVLLSFAAGLGWSAMMRNGANGRWVGAGAFLITSLMLFNWLVNLTRHFFAMS